MCIDIYGKYAWVVILKDNKGISIHCVKNAQIQSFSGPYYPAFRLNLDGYGVSLLKKQFPCSGY